jgi:hypothetical protein
MRQSDEDIRQRAAELAEEVSAGVTRGKVNEWLEEVLGSALLDVARRERERCAGVAEERVVMWEASLGRMGTRDWPAVAVAEARARLNEARALADALRVSVSPPPKD